MICKVLCNRGLMIWQFNELSQNNCRIFGFMEYRRYVNYQLPSVRQEKTFLYWNEYDDFRQNFHVYVFFLVLTITN
jgi:hypothetical protein